METCKMISHLVDLRAFHKRESAMPNDEDDYGYKVIVTGPPYEKTFLIIGSSPFLNTRVAASLMTNF
jgi:hypothetical protein